MNLSPSYILERALIFRNWHRNSNSWIAKWSAIQSYWRLECTLNSHRLEGQLEEGARLEARKYSIDIGLSSCFLLYFNIGCPMMLWILLFLLFITQGFRIVSLVFQFGKIFLNIFRIISKSFFKSRYLILSFFSLLHC